MARLIVVEAGERSAPPLSVSVPRGAQDAIARGEEIVPPVAIKSVPPVTVVPPE